MRSAATPASGCARRAAIARRIVLITPAARHELAGAQGSGLHRLSGQAGARRLACGAPRRPTADAFERGGDDADASAAARRDQPRPRGLAILVAEDNEINALLARALLARLGHRPTVVTNGDAAVDAWRAARAAGDALRSRADGRAHAGQRRHRGDARASARPKPSAASRARRSSRSPPTPSTRTATPASPPAWTAS